MANPDMMSLLNSQRDSLKGQISKLAKFISTHEQSEAVLTSRLTVLQRIRVKFEEPRLERYKVLRGVELDEAEQSLPEKYWENSKRPDVPWRSFFTSIPFYALCVAFFGMFWSSIHFQVVHPTFLGSVLHFPIDQIGILATGPFLLNIIFGLLGGWISSVFNRRKWMGVDKVRKMSSSAACVGYSAGLVGIYMSGCDEASSIAFCMFCIAVQGFFTPGCQIVPADMSPNFAGTIVGLASAFGATSGFLFPYVVGWLTDSDNSLQQWNKIMFISFGVCMASCVIFDIFGSADIQPWNFVTDKNTESEMKKKETDA